MPTDVQAEFEKLHAYLFAKDDRHGDRSVISIMLGERVAPTDTRAMVVAAYRLGVKDGKGLPRSEAPKESTPAESPVIVASITPDPDKAEKRSSRRK